MSFYYSFENNGFYNDDVHEQLPVDARPLTDEEYTNLLDGISQGKVLLPPDAEHAAPYLADPPPPTLEEQQEMMKAEFTTAIDTYMNTFAMTRGYDTMASAATYYDDEDSIFNAEGTYAKRMRSQIYRVSYAILNAVLSGQRPMPTIEEVMAELPKLEWPEVTV